MSRPEERAPALVEHGIPVRPTSVTASPILEPHPLADLLPVMSEADLSELTEDIRRNGQLTPITLYEGKVLDGRHRLMACQHLGIEPTTVDFHGDNPAAHVLSLNVQRRHLTASQRAMLATRFLPELEKEAMARMTAGAATPVPMGTRAANGRATEHAGALVGVGRSSVSRAERVAREAPELVPKVMSGEMSVRAADAIVVERATTEPRMPRAAPQTQRQRELARAQCDRINKIVWALDGYMQGIPEIKLDMALSVATEDELEHWRERLSAASRTFRDLRNHIHTEDS